VPTPSLPRPRVSPQSAADWDETGVRVRDRNKARISHRTQNGHSRTAPSPPPTPLALSPPHSLSPHCRVGPLLEACPCTLLTTPGSHPSAI